MKSPRTCAWLVLALIASAFAGACDEQPQPGEPLRTLAIIGEPGSTPGAFTIPRAIATDGKLLWIVDKSDRIQKFDPDTGKCLAWWHVPECKTGKPTGLTIAPAPPGVPGVAAGDPVLYVAHTHNHQILIYPLDERQGITQAAVEGAPGSEFTTPSMLESHPPILAQWGSFGTGPGQFVYPTDVAVLTGDDGRGVERFYVSEYGNEGDRVSVFDPTFKFLFSFGTYGPSAAADNVQFDRPQSVEIDPATRELIVADARNHRIGRFTLEGKLIAWIGSPETAGAAPGQWRYPWSALPLGDGTALVTEFGNNRVTRVDLSGGVCLGTFGRAGREKGELAQPWAIAIMGDRTFVLDTSNHRVQMIATPPPQQRTRSAQ